MWPHTSSATFHEGVAQSYECAYLDCLRSAFAGADADAVLQRQNEDFAVADAALRSGASCLHDGVDGRLDEVFVDGDLQLHFAQQIHCQLVAAIHFGMALLPTETLHVHDREAEDLDFVEGFLDGFQLRRLDNGEDEFHTCFVSVVASGRDTFIVTAKARRRRVIPEARPAD